MLKTTYGFNFSVNTNLEMNNEKAVTLFDWDKKGMVNLPNITVSTKCKNYRRAQNKEFLSENESATCYFLDDSFICETKKEEIITIQNDKINIYFNKNDDETLENIYNILFGPAVTLLSRLVGRLVLHGSAVLYENQAILIIGPSGRGKTSFTIAANLLKNAPIISEDTLVIDPEGDYLYKGNTDIYLCQDTHDYFFEGVGERNDLRQDKIFVSKKSHIDAHKTPISKIIFLEEQKETSEIKEKATIDMFKSLSANIKMAITGTNKMKLKDNIIISKLLKDKELISISLSKDLNQLPETIEKIFDTFERNRYI